MASQAGAPMLASAVQNRSRSALVNGFAGGRGWRGSATVMATQKGAAFVMAETKSMLRARAKIMSSTFLFGSYGVVPFPMKVCGFYVELGHLFVSDFDSGFVFAIIDGGFHDEPFGCACGRY
jgi:hypothetical protein